MPSYTFEIRTESGTERYPFTLDDDRQLGPQVTQILEELRQRGVVLRGGQTDVLAIYQAGTELDASQRPGDLGLSPGTPIELRMREPSATRSAGPSRLPRGIAASALFGYAGAFLAWLVAGIFTDLTDLISSYQRLDQVAICLLGAAAGAAVLAGAALRQRRSVVVGAASGLLLGGAGTLLGGSAALLLIHPASPAAFLGYRLLAWALAGVVGGAFLACHAVPLAPGRVGESATLGLIAGAMSGAVLGLPGPSELWQAVAWLLFGAALGVAVTGPLLWHASAMVELQHPRGLPTMVSLREWPILEGSSVQLGSAQLAAQEGQVAFYPPASGASVNGGVVTQPVYLPSGGALEVAGAHYQVRSREARR